MDFTKAYATQVIEEFMDEFVVDPTDTWKAQRWFLATIMSIYRADPADTEQIEYGIRVLKYVAAKRGIKTRYVEKTVRHARKLMAEGDPA
jgi:hypothetical protein